MGISTAKGSQLLTPPANNECTPIWVVGKFSESRCWHSRRPLFSEKKFHKRKKLSRCSFSAFSTSVYSKGWCSFIRSHIQWHTPKVRQSKVRRKTFSVAEEKKTSLRFHRRIARRDKITIIHSFNVNSSVLRVVIVVVTSFSSSFGEESMNDVKEKKKAQRFLFNSCFCHFDPFSNSITFLIPLRLFFPSFE